MSLESAGLGAWLGRSETMHDVAGRTPVAALTATLDHPPSDIPPGTALPPLWHWLYFLPIHRQSAIGADGHAKRGGFLPPVPLPRRMWAGSQFEFVSPVRIGDRLARTSTIEDVTTKEGRTGALVFVKVRHEVRCNDAAAGCAHLSVRARQPAGALREGEALLGAVGPDEMPEQLGALVKSELVKWKRVVQAAKLTAE